MSANLPPSERDLEIYESVCIARRSLRSAAQLHDLSVTRVRQLVKRVTDWLADTLPPETDVGREKQLQLARHIAADQIQYAQCELMDLWRETQNPSYLLKSTRLSLAAARLGVLPGAIDGHIADAWDEAEGAQTPDPKELQELVPSVPAGNEPTQASSLGSADVRPATSELASSSCPSNGDCAPITATSHVVHVNNSDTDTTNDFTSNDLHTQHSSQQSAHATSSTRLRAPQAAADPYRVPEFSLGSDECGPAVKLRVALGEPLPQ